MKQKFFLLVMTLLISLCGWADEQGYAVFDESTGTLTFKYGEKPVGDNVYDTDDTPTHNSDYSVLYKWMKESWIGEDHSNSKNIMQVVFDVSYANARPKSTSQWFYYCNELKEVVGMENLNTSEVTDMSYMFYCCSGLTSINLSCLNTENVTNMSYMLSCCWRLSNIDLKSLKTENVTDMSGMFYGCTGLTSIDLSSLNTENVTNMSHMFDNCSGLTNIDLSPLKTESVTNMSGMFFGCMGLTSIDLRPLKTENVTDMSFLFGGCKSLTNVDLSTLQTDEVKNMQQMFYMCEALISVKLCQTKNVTSMRAMFGDCVGLTNIDLSPLNTENVTDMNGLFSGCKNLTSIDLSSLNTEKVTNMSFMFSGCNALVSINFGDIKTDMVTNMSGLFYDCWGLTSIDLGSLNTENVEDMSCMFYSCLVLEKIDLSNFDMRKVKKTNDMFNNCRKLETIIFGENFTLENANNDSSMGISQCANLKSITIDRDVPTIPNPSFFDNAISILYVPEQYLPNYIEKYEDGMFYGGYFTLRAIGSEEDAMDGEPSTPVFNRKKLLSISQDGDENRRVDFEYDEQGRIIKFTHTRSDKVTVYDYTYDGENINITCGSSKYEYLIKNGRVKSGSWYLSQDYATEEFAYLYNVDKHMTQIANLTNNSSAKKYVYSWDAGNPTSMSFYRNNELRVQTDFSYNQVTSEPMIHAIFGFGEGEKLYLDEIFDKVALYPYMGTLPKNLFAHNKVKEVRNGSYSGEDAYSFDYETNEKGDIVKVIINKNVYHLEWEDNYTTDEDIATTNKGNADYGEGGNINEQTYLNGNIINNVYYNISSSNGGYNSTEGCIVVNTPTKEDDIDGKDIFGEDFKNHFTGIVFKVAAGSGSIKVKAETVGGMLLKVRIGNNEPFEMMMKGSIAATFPYNVDKPTYVYIYAGNLSDMSRTRESSDSVLKIYGIEWESDVINGDANDDGIVNAADILKVVNYIMGNLSGNLNMDAADANGDGMVNTEDIVKIVNIIKGN